MAWFLALVCGVVVLALYRRMVSRVEVTVPARTHLAGWQGLGLTDGSDRTTFLAFTVSFIGLLFLSWPAALAWLALVLLGMELLRRRHNDALAAG